MTPDTLFFSNSSQSALVRALCREVLGRGVNLSVSRADEMFYVFYFNQGLSLDQAMVSYLDSGRRIWAVQRQILFWRFGDEGGGGRVLDFASGYGRVTRHILGDLAKERLWVADISAEAVAFQRDELGVHGLVSTPDPEDFRCELTFDCILVSSLFTHLPEPLFHAWLRRLGALLAPGGLLQLSVHDMSLRPPDVAPGPAGIAFAERSESGTLDPRLYGSSWVSEAFVRGAVRQALGDRPVLRIPRGLASYQDLYVVLDEEDADAAAAFSGLAVEREADGYMESCSWISGRSYRLSGWVADRVAGQPPREVRIRIDGALVASCRDLPTRPEGGQAFPGDAVEVVGWQATVDLPEGSAPESARLAIQAVSVDGEARTLYAGRLEDACLRTVQLDIACLREELKRKETDLQELAGRKAACEAQLAASRLQAEELAARVRAMQASRFWKMRNLWFRGKRALGLTREP